MINAYYIEKVSIMILYDYLFYCSYKMGMRSKNFNGLPVLAGMMMITPSVIMHVITIDLIISGLGATWFAEIMENKILRGLSYYFILLLVYSYYSYNGRYKKIILRYNSMRNTFWKRHPFVFYIFYFLVSMILSYLSATFYHREGLFRMLD